MHDFHCVGITLIERLPIRILYPGKPDGEQAMWIDGKLLGHWRGINWRKADGLKANALTLESYVTDRWTRNPVNTVYFDNLIIAREYIGPTGK